MTEASEAAPSGAGESSEGPAPTAHWRPARKHPLVLVAILAVGCAAIFTIMRAWDLLPFTGSVQVTENAYVRGRTAVISPQVSGYVIAVEVRDYQTVRAGDVLVRIDESSYRAKVDMAQANLSAAEAALANNRQAKASAEASLQGQAAAVASARAQLLRGKADMARAGQLVGDGSISIRERDQTKAALAQVEAQLGQSVSGQEVARQNVLTIDVARGGLEAQVAAARAQLDAALIDLGHTTIRAVEPGQLGEIGVRVGQYVTNGTQLTSLVPADRWIIAAFKEAQTAHMRVGQKVSFTVDGLDSARLAGRVEELSPAAASEFSVLKPDNATGNFVKVPQRIGVRISINPGQALAPRLRPGMSVEVRVDTGGPS
ncbi:HlyD family secretion protein [Bradyrhizobium canariense]|uniref:Multidrug resistance efflux pump n=1 Tax=Bradyrhizobium canariense TaxID=255045 RepID=A0A1H2AIB5_9BRAD|nr:HlyD family secretion protein [Bradyrhizobium canariense]SDT45502.1 Multidrug resistance efflux pump [Bradyrhizobium canariense]